MLILPVCTLVMVALASAMVTKKLPSICDEEALNASFALIGSPAELSSRTSPTSFGQFAEKV
jgi:hypothetical protein